MHSIQRATLSLVLFLAIALSLSACGSDDATAVPQPAPAAPAGGTPPDAPLNVVAAAGDGQVTVSWDAVSGATTYNLYHGSIQGVTEASGAKVADATSPYVHTGLSNGTTYYYVATALNAAGESPPSAVVSATPMVQYSNDATLAGLSLSAGSLSPAFAAAVTAYTTAYLVGTASITVTPVAAHSGATLTVNGMPVASGTASPPILLNLGNTSVAVVVTAQDGTTKQTYALNVLRGLRPEAYLKAPNAEVGDQFGISVAISGDTIVVASDFEDSNVTAITNGPTAAADNIAGNAGAAYVFVRSGTAWSQQAYLKAPNAESADNFGNSVAISGDTIVVGAAAERSSQTTVTNGSTVIDDNLAPTAGAAYVFVRSGANWSHEAYLKAPNAEAGDWFGNSVAIAGDTIVVGAYQEDSNQQTVTNGASASPDNSALGAGAAYVFVRSGAAWSHQSYLKAPNAQANDVFGVAVAISGDTIVVGAQAEDSNQTTVINGAGASSNNSATSAGAAYVFVRSGTVWSPQAYLKAPNAEFADGFGSSVAISGDSIVVGAQIEGSSQTTITNGPSASPDNSAPNAGAAYVFARSGTVWSPQAYLKAPNAEAGDKFGFSVAISGDTTVVSTRFEASSQTTITNGATASADNSAAGAGAAYMFVRSGTAWSQQAYLKAPNAESADNFGNSVAISGDTIVVGAAAERSSQTTITNGAGASPDNSAVGAGAAYVIH